MKENKLEGFHLRSFKNQEYNLYTQWVCGKGKKVENKEIVAIKFKIVITFACYERSHNFKRDIKR